jgi:hypothetical protein
MGGNGRMRAALTEPRLDHLPASGLVPAAATTTASATPAATAAAALASAAPIATAAGTSPAAAIAAVAAAFTHRPRFVDHQRAPEKILAIAGLNRAIRFAVIFDFDESEPAGLSGELIADDLN